MLSLASLSTAFAPPSVAHIAPASAQRATSVRMETEADLKALAEELNPSIGYCAALGMPRTVPLSPWSNHAAQLSLHLQSCVP